MAGGVARRVDHAGGGVADLHGVALAHDGIELRNARGFLLRRNHAATVPLFQVWDAGGMVVMMMRDQNIGEFPAGRLERGLDGAALRRVDRRGGAGGRSCSRTP